LGIGGVSHSQGVALC